MGFWTVWITIGLIVTGLNFIFFFGKEIQPFVDEFEGIGHKTWKIHAALLFGLFLSVLTWPIELRNFVLNVRDWFYGEKKENDQEEGNP